ncbi:hypothetical protein Pla52n_48930 [Stieleria varia]|uniref:Uncharacterized protein n=1 Tax=Stieleria varia TaxID=2528005 RepID=A0A5C6AG02_9BACT|nr:hypothetical protein Pla52n_48930 [Stieleria varia]
MRHGYNIVKPPEETGGKQGKQTVTYTKETPAYSPKPAIGCF